MDASPDLLALGAAVTAVVIGGLGALVRRHRPVTGSVERLHPPAPDEAPGAFERALETALKRIRPEGAVGIAVFEIDSTPPYPLGGGPPHGRLVMAAIDQVLGSAVAARGAVHCDGARFLAVLPEMTEVEAARTAEMARHSVEVARVVSPVTGRPVTVSAGVAVVQREPSRALQLADAALYEAQAGGGNRVAMAEVPAELRSPVRGPSDPPAWLRGAEA